jgi:hypothetical protein
MFLAEKLAIVSSHVRWSPRDEYQSVLHRLCNPGVRRFNTSPRQAQLNDGFGCVRCRYEAAAPIGQKEKPATACRARETAKAVTTKGRGLRSAPLFIVIRRPQQTSYFPATSREVFARRWIRINGLQHLGFRLQIIVLALPRHFFLMRPEIAHAPQDFIAF